MRKVIVELDKLGDIAGVLLRGGPALWPTEGGEKRLELAPQR